MSILTRSSLVLLAALPALAACSAAPDSSPEGLVGAPEVTDSSEEGVSGNLPAGSTLKATANVNLRTGASTSKSILNVVAKGDSVTLVSSAPQNGFYKVQYNGTVGWSFGKYFDLVEEEEEESSSTGGGTAVCTGEGQKSWSCSGSFNTQKAADCEYYATAFGCWKDSNGVNHGDPGDNCIPACLNQAKQSICAGLSGPACERKVSWFAAGKGRWGCMQRLKVTNPENGKAAVIVVLDAGPACWVESKIDAPVADLSYPTAYYLFGHAPGTGDGERVIVEEVDASTPLGPQ